MHRIAKIWKGLESELHLVYRPVKRDQIARGEDQLGVEFPRSYKELVLDRGAPGIAPRRDQKPCLENLGYGVMTPPEIVTWTRDLRRAPDPDMADDEEAYEATKANLNRAVWFQLGAHASEGFVWLTDHRSRTTGEMWVADYNYQWMYELQWDKLSAVVWPSLEKSTAHVAKQIRAHTAEHGKFTW
jgi:hypothetical protein